MLLKSTLSITALLLVLGTSCTDDKKKPAEPVSASASSSETPAAPNGASGSAELNNAPIYFGFDDYTLSPEAQSTLTAMAEGLKITDCP